MKNSNKKNFAYSVINTLISKTTALMLLSFVLIVQCGICQQTTPIQKGNFGLSASSMVSADGYGTQYLPAVYYKKNRSCFLGGPIIQKNKMNLSGAQFNYEYTMVKEGEAFAERLELFCFATGIYQHNAILGKYALHNESVANPEFTENMCELHFKTVEIYGGAGLRIKLFKNVKWVNSLGVGGYSCFNFPQHLYYAEHNLGLFLKTGISIDLKN